MQEALISDSDASVSPNARETELPAFRLLKIGVVAILVLSCAFPVAVNLVDPDLWGHVKYGQDCIADGQLHRTATHTYTAIDYPWINHENAAELLFASAYDLFGIYPMVVAKCLLGLGIFATMVWMAHRRNVHLILAWAWMVVVAVNLRGFFPMRPQLLSFLLFSISMVCVDRAFDNWRSKWQVNYRWLWPLPVIFATWTNSHGGFVAGLCVVGALLAGRMLELFLAQGRQSLPQQFQLAAVGLACVAATLINPYGINMHMWLLESLGEARPEISEWAPPTFGKPVFFPFVTLVALTVGMLVATRQHRDWPKVVILILVGWQASSHLRHIAFFALLCGFWLPAHFQSALARLKPLVSRRIPTLLPPAWLRIPVAAALLAVITFQSMLLADRLSIFPVFRNKYPVDAIQHMVDHRLQGRLIVSFNWAQYAIAALAPESTVQFDGRFRTCYPRVVADMHFDFLAGARGGLRNRAEESGPLEPRRVLEYRDPELVLLDHKFPFAAAVMQKVAAEQHPKWVLLYRDRVAAVWGVSSRFGNPSSPDYVPESERVFDTSSRSGCFHWPALPDYSLWEEAEEVSRRGHEPSASDAFGLNMPESHSLSPNG